MTLIITWEDIDPTFWIEVDEEGVEHRILGWGNVRFINCELNEDMISIKIKDGVNLNFLLKRLLIKQMLILRLV